MIRQTFRIPLDASQAEARTEETRNRVIPSENRSPIGPSSSFFVIRGQVRSSVTVSIVARPSVIHREPVQVHG